MKLAAAVAVAGLAIAALAIVLGKRFTAPP